MTDKQFETAKRNKTKIYMIWFKERKLHKKLLPLDNLEGRWILQEWVNTTTPYDNNLNCYIRYVTEDKFDKQVEKYFKDLRKDYVDQIKYATRMLNKLDSAIEAYKKEKSNEDSSDT